MKYLIKAAEVWQPDLTGRALVLSSAHFGSNYGENLQEFQKASQAMQFGVNEGLPGITWAARRPLIWTDLNSAHFKRRDLAENAGLECGLSIPVFAGEFLLGVVVLFFAADDQVSGAVEVWHNHDYYDKELRLNDGYYGAMEKLAFVSQRLSIMYGRGLPGTAWQQATPVIMNNLAESTGFLRARNAAEYGISTGIAVPFFYTDRDVQVVALLSTDDTPVARRFEVWRPDESRRYLLFSEGYCAEGNDLQAEYRGIAFDRNESIMGEVWLNGRPVACPSAEPGSTGAVYIPVVINGLLDAVVKFEF
ncbi:GAF domain-containing protein [Parahaliea maris]|uniref:GAF domain-containing protein n=1 Tax=Parahaliea maris TaxID=2716870 RepID=A0A5C9A049_9GAMM|nr:GAF domain-containing protein [Parahaliea maris]TXS94136.1 GAF domain-containing protein [Parahaliea maris]